MASASSESSVIVVVQREAACPFWMEHWGRDPAADWSMLEQEEWEPEEAFRLRLDSTLDRLALAAGEETSVVLVASGREDGPAVAERWRLARELVGHVERVGGELVVTRGFGHRDQPQPALEALVRDLVAERQAAAVRLRLAEAPPVSRVRTSSMPPPTAARGASA